MSTHPRIIDCGAITRVLPSPDRMGPTRRFRYEERVAIGDDLGMSQEDSDLVARIDVSLPGFSRADASVVCETVDRNRSFFAGGQLLGSFARPRDKHGVPIALPLLMDEINDAIEHCSMQRVVDAMDDKDELDAIARAQRAAERVKAAAQAQPTRVQWSKPPVVGGQA